MDKNGQRSPEIIVLPQSVSETSTKCKETIAFDMYLFTLLRLYHCGTGERCFHVGFQTRDTQYTLFALCEVERTKYVPHLCLHPKTQRHILRKKQPKFDYIL